MVQCFAKKQNRMGIYLQRLLPLTWRYVEIGFVRGVAIVLALGTSVWTARMMGPQKMGVSGVLLSFIGPATLLVVMNQDVQLIRLFRTADHDEERSRLISLAVSFRFVACCVLITVGFLAAVFSGTIDLVVIGLLGGALQLIADGNPAYWVIQALDRSEVQMRCNALAQLVTASLTFAFIGPATATGYDLLAAGCGAACANAVAWSYCASIFRVRAEIKFYHIPRAYLLFKEGKWLFITGGLVYIYTSFDQVLVPWLVGIEEFGVYRTALQINRGVTAFTFIVPMLLYPKLIDKVKLGGDHLWKAQLAICKKAAIILIPLACIATIAIVKSYPYIYGPKYETAAWPCALLVVSKLVAIGSGVFVWGQWALKRDRLMLLVLGTGALASLVTNIVLIPRTGLIGAAITNLVIEAGILGAVILTSHPRKP